MDESKIALESGDKQRAVELAYFAMESIRIELDSCTDPDEKKFLEQMWSTNEAIIDNLLAEEELEQRSDAVRESEGTASLTKEVNSSNTNSGDSRFDNKYKSVTEIPKLTFDDVEGMDELKEDLRRTIIYPIIYKDKMNGLNTPGQNFGIVLYGPPGCGKTYFAQAAAGEIAKQANKEIYFASIKGSEIKSMWEGKSLENLRRVFEDAAAAADRGELAYLFFDELTGLGHKKNEVNENSNELLEEFKSDFTIIEGKPVFVIGATNYPWDLDTILVRQERFGSKVYVPPPDVKARRGILRILAEGASISEDVDFEYLAEITECYAGADLKALYKMAESFTFEDRINNDNERPVCMEDFLRAKQKVRSSLGPWASEILHDSGKLRGTPYEIMLDDAVRIIEVLRERGEYYE